MSIASRREENSRLAAMSLPTELLAEIFLYACTLTDAEVKSGAQYPGQSGVQDVLRSRRGTIVATCSHWHEVGIGLGELWSCISVKIFGELGGKDLYIPTLPLLLLELKRSGEVPLSLKIVAQNNIQEETTYFSTLRSAFPKCRALTILRARGSFKLANSERLIEGSPPTSFPALRSINLSSWSYTDTLDLSLAPALEHISLNGTMTVIPRVFPKLTSLVLGSAISSELAVPLIKESQDTLEYLKWTFVLGKGPSLLAPESLHLPTLKYLSLLPTYYRDPEFAPINPTPLAAFSVPQLAHLQTYQYRERSPKDGIQLPSVRYLSYSFNYQPDDARGLESCFQLLNDLHNLEELHINPVHNIGEAQGFIMALRERDEATGVFKRLPKLQKMTAYFTSAKVAADLVEERNSGKQEGLDHHFALHLLLGTEIFNELHDKFPTHVFHGFAEAYFRSRE